MRLPNVGGGPTMNNRLCALTRASGHAIRQGEAM